MSFTAINTLVAAGLMSIGLAQATSSQSKPAPTPEAGIPITVAGCLKKWEPAMAARGGLLNPAKLEYVLTDLAPGTAATPALPNVLSYLVRTKDTTVALMPHLNHRVEVTGTVTGLAASNPTAPPQPVAPTLTVAAVKMLSTECL